MSDFKNMTVVELKAYAKENSIDLKDAKTKTKIVAALNNIKADISLAEESNVVIGSTTTIKEKRIPKSATKSDQSGVITTTTADTFKDKDFKKNKNNDKLKVAIYSEKNMHWVSVGRISNGYNIVSEEESEKWLSRRGVRKATPQEVATYYGI